MRLSLIALTCACSLPAATSLYRQFLNPPADSRIMMRWWWFGPSVTKAQLDREMRLMKEGGIGGFEVQPVYPLQLERNLLFLSPEFLDHLRFTADRAHDLGLRFDLTLGSGWPYGGPTIPLEQAAGRLRVERRQGDSKPQLREGEAIIAEFPGLVFISSHTRQMVKRPSAGGEGYVLDHYSRTALDTYLEHVGEPLLKPLAGRLPYAIFCDSLEAFGSDWTPDLLNEFHKRRGYDLKPHLPALVDNIGPNTPRIRHDWGLTLTELFEDRFLAPLHRWSKDRGVQFRIQGYGIPPAVVSSNAHTDIAEGEGSQWKVVRASRWASSANHLYGRPVTTSETWTWLHSPVFRATPLDVKVEADIHFVQGINQLIGHGWPYTAEGVEYPGWRFYASGVFNDKNPWWIVMPDIAAYLQRVSFLLRQGRPANDVALYMPNSDAWSHFTPGRVHMIESLREHVGELIMPQILDTGYGLDFVDDRALQNLARIDGKSLAIGDGRYRAVVLPGVEFIPPASMRKLEQFAKAGGIVIAARRLPSAAPGMAATSDDNAEVSAVAPRLFQSAVPDAQLGAALRAALVPDMHLDAVLPSVGMIHRTTPEGEIYFVINSSNAPVSTKAAFRVDPKLQPEFWNAFTGVAVPAPVSGRTDNAVTVPLELEPHGSRIVVFRPGSPRPAGALVAGTAIDLSTNWAVRIGDSQQTFDKLRSWTDDERTRFYSGTATYERSVTVTESLLKRAAELRLDLGAGAAVAIPPVDPMKRSGPGMRAWFDGPVREAAVVYVNGQRAGSVWCPPYELDVKPFLKPGANQIRIVVANLAVNHMAGRPLPDYKQLRAKFGNRFDPQDMDRIQPVPSGLFGPVRLVAWSPGT